MKLLHKLSNFIEKDAWIQFKNSVIFYDNSNKNKYWSKKYHLNSITKYKIKYLRINLTRCIIFEIKN